MTSHRATFRFVAIYNRAHQRWHSYVTNLPTTMMNAEHSRPCRRTLGGGAALRELKDNYRIEHMPSASKRLTETLIYAALLSLAISRRIYRTLAIRPPERFNTTLDRFALVHDHRPRPARRPALLTDRR